MCETSRSGRRANRRTLGARFAVQERGGLVWVCLAEPESREPLVRPWHDDTALQSFVWQDRVNCGLADGLENLLDATHTPSVHSGLVRSESQSKLFTAIVRVSDAMVEVEYTDEGTQEGLISRIFERNRTESFGRFIPPCLAELEYRSTRGVEFVLNSWFVPANEDSQAVFSTVYLRRSWIPLFLRRAVISPFFRRVLSQDQAVLELQRQNLERFGDASYQLWEGDLMRGWIDTWLQTGHLPDSQSEFTLSFYL